MQIEYNVPCQFEAKPKDIQALIDFCESDNENMCITYDNHGDCTKRRMALRTWLCKSKYKFKIYLRVRDNKLFVLREKEI